MSRPNQRGKRPSSTSRNRNPVKPRVAPTAPLPDIDLSQQPDPLAECTPTVPLEPLTLKGVITEEVGSPRNDGSAGSALYEVPIRLNRMPDEIEKQLITTTWDHPPQFTSMHRPGILEIVGDKLILGRTTIDEVKDVHASTLSLVIDSVNAQAAQYRQEVIDAEAVQQEHLDRHRQHVSDMASRIEF